MTYYDRAAEAVRLRAAGMSVRAIARQLGASKSSVQRWLAAAPAPAQPHPAPPVSAALGTAAMLSAVVATAEQVHEQALEGGEAAIACRAGVDLASATAISARVATPTVEGVELDDAEITATIADIYARAQDVVAEHEAVHGPMRCSSCGVRMRLAPMSGDGDEAPAPAPVEPPQTNPALRRAAEVFDRMTSTVEVALEDGNLKAAQRANRSRTDAVRVYARAERTERERRAERLHFVPQETIDQRWADMRTHAAALGAVPIMCPPCLSRTRMAAVGASVTDVSA